MHLQARLHQMREERVQGSRLSTRVATRVHLQAVARWVPDKLRQALDDGADFVLLVGQHCVVVELARMVELCNMSYHTTVVILEAPFVSFLGGWFLLIK